jgi:hypothetical protein
LLELSLLCVLLSFSHMNQHKKLPEVSCSISDISSMKLIKDFDVQDEDPIKTNHTSTILGRSCFMNQQEKLLEVSF